MLLTIASGGHNTGKKWKVFGPAVCTLTRKEPNHARDQLLNPEGEWASFLARILEGNIAQRLALGERPQGPVLSARC